MGNWSKLKADEKVRVIKFARLNGVSDIKTIRDTYNLYSNGGNLVHKYGGELVGLNLDLNYIQQRDDFKGNFITKLVPRLWGRHGDLSRYYFGQPAKDNALVYSLFKPSKSNNPSAKYIAIALPEFKDYIVNAYFQHPEYFVDDKHYNGNSYSLFVNKNHKLNNYDLNNLGTFTLGKGRDERGDYLSYYDIWDTDTSKQSNPDLQKEYWGAAKPFEVYDRIYLDDYYEVPNTEKGTIFLPEIIVTPNTNQKSTGGPLYPFSFEKNPLLKTPVVRYDEGGHTYTVKKGDTFSLIALNVGVSVLDLQKLNPTITNVNRIREGLSINIPTYMFSEIFNTPQSTGLSIPQVLRIKPLQQQNTPILSVEVPAQKGLKTAGPLDLQELAVRQAYTESGLRHDIVNDKGAYGLFQIMQPALDDYNRINKTNYTLEDMKDADNNIKVRNWYMDYLSNLGFINKGDIQSDSVGMYKVLASFNAGAGNVKDALTRAKADGKDIYDSWDWVSYLWDEPREYADFILRGIETKGTNKNDSVYKAVSTAKSGTANKIRSSVK